MADQISELSHQFGVSVAVVHVLEWLKRAGWFPWLTNNSTTALRIISAVVATATAAGFKVLSGDYQHGWTLAVPPLSAILDTLVHSIAGWGAQNGYYSLAVKSDGLLKTVINDMQQMQPNDVQSSQGKATQ